MTSFVKTVSNPKPTLLLICFNSSEIDLTNYREDVGFLEGLCIAGIILGIGMLFNFKNILAFVGLIILIISGTKLYRLYKKSRGRIKERRKLGWDILKRQAGYHRRH